MLCWFMWKEKRGEEWLWNVLRCANGVEYSERLIEKEQIRRCNNVNGRAELEGGIGMCNEETLFKV